jgi:predicted acetyltransferase
MTESDREAFVALRRSTFRLSPEGLEASWKIPADEVLVAVTGNQLVGSIRCERIGQMVGGHPVSCGLVTAVAVDPAYRSGGVGRRLLADAFAMMRSQGVAMSTLHASSPAPYRRAGYEVAGVRSRWQLRLGLLGSRVAGPTSHRTVPAQLNDPHDKAALRKAYGRFAGRHTGLVDRTDAWWDTRVLTGTEDTPMECFVALDEAATVAGYVLLSRLPRTDAVALGEPDFSFDLYCHDLVWLDVGAAEALLQLFRGYRAIADVLHWPGPPVDPLATLLADHAPTMVPSFGYLSRIVDVEEAFTQRRWGPNTEADLRLRVFDPLVPGNDRSFRLTVRDGRGAVEPVAVAELSIDIGALSALFCGAITVSSMRALGRVTGPFEALTTLEQVLPPAMPWVMDVF